MKRNAIFRIVLFSLAIVILSGILLAGLLAGQFMFNTETFVGETIIEMSSLPASKIRNLDIDWAAGSITIQPDDVDDITIAESETSDENNKMIWKQSGDTLSIEFCKTRVFVGISTDFSKELVITVPRDWECDELDIDSAAAEVIVCDVHINEVSLDGAAGQCSFVNCVVDAMSVDTASGDVEFNGTLNTLDFDAASAKCTLNLSNTPRQIDVDTMSGDLNIALPANTGFTASLEGMSSSFNSEFPTTSVNGSYTFGDGSCRINVDAMSANVNILKGE